MGTWHRCLPRSQSGPGPSRNLSGRRVGAPGELVPGGALRLSNPRGMETQVPWTLIGMRPPGNRGGHINGRDSGVVVARRLGSHSGGLTQRTGCHAAPVAGLVTGRVMGTSAVRAYGDRRPDIGRPPGRATQRGRGQSSGRSVGCFAGKDSRVKQRTARIAVSHCIQMGQ